MSNSEIFIRGVDRFLRHGIPPDPFIGTVENKTLLLNTDNSPPKSEPISKPRIEEKTVFEAYQSNMRD